MRVCVLSIFVFLDVLQCLCVCVYVCVHMCGMRACHACAYVWRWRRVCYRRRSQPLYLGRTGWGEKQMLGRVKACCCGFSQSSAIYPTQPRQHHHQTRHLHQIQSGHLADPFIQRDLHRVNTHIDTPTCRVNQQLGSSVLLRDTSTLN